jgi:hypothetical protein
MERLLIRLSVFCWFLNHTGSRLQAKILGKTVNYSARAAMKVTWPMTSITGKRPGVGGS